jgi:hypothetical protein
LEASHTSLDGGLPTQLQSRPFMLWSLTVR